MAEDDALVKSMRRRFQYHDKDGDGKLSSEEVLEMLGEGEHRVDLDEKDRSTIREFEFFDFEEFYGVWESLVYYDSAGDESEPQDRRQDETPASTPVPEPVPEPELEPELEPEPKPDSEPQPEPEPEPTPRNNVGTPPPRGQKVITPPRPGPDDSTAPRRPPPLPAPANRARKRPDPPSKDSAPVRPRMMTAVSDKKYEIAQQAGYAPALEQQEQQQQQQQKGRRKKQSGGAFACCGARSQEKAPSHQQATTVPPSTTLTPPDVMPPIPPFGPQATEPPVELATEPPVELVAENDLSIPADTPVEEAGELEHTPRRATADAQGSTAPTALASSEEVSSLTEQDATEQEQVEQSEGLELHEAEPPESPAAVAQEIEEYTDSPRGSNSSGDRTLKRTSSSWTRNPTPPRTRPSDLAQTDLSHQATVDAALNQAQAAKQYAEQMLEAAHAAQAEAVQAARDAATVHATAEARAAAQQLLAEAHAAAEKEMEAARIRATEMIAVAEAVGAERVAASAASVNQMFDELHPDLATTHPSITGFTAPTQPAAQSPDVGSPTSLQAVARVAGALPQLSDITSLSEKALENIKASSTSHIKAHHGCIYVTIHEATDLKNMEVFGKMSPFVIMEVEGFATKRTATHEKGGKTPTWDEAFVFPINYGEGDEVSLQFTVWDDENIPSKQKEGKTNKDDYCGSAVVSLTDVIRNDSVQIEGDEKEWLDLDTCGKLCVSMRYKEGELALLHT